METLHLLLASGLLAVALAFGVRAYRNRKRGVLRLQAVLVPRPPHLALSAVLRPVPPPEPWREHPYGGEAFYVPRVALELIADPRRLEECQRLRADWIEHVRQDIAANGIREPLLIVVDQRGRLTLNDGHHRLLATRPLEMHEQLPARLTVSEEIRGWRRPASEVLTAFLR